MAYLLRTIFLFALVEKGVTKRFKAEAHLNEIANGAYNKGTTQESNIRSPLHRLLHWLIANTINYIQEGDKCLTIDVFLLWAFTTPDVYVDLPFLLADFLVTRAGKDRRGSPLYGDEPPDVPIIDEIPMDHHNIAMRRFDDNFTWGVNYTNISLDHLMQQMHVT
ncbi:unnamed protein product [Lactuca saligna]|uniref:Uncharacterized protein n=1 Tax=Lactuca saligna TaxID=75948 RepID=A0AA35YVL2_LACSI|nr:unnamed protein product [Lactuca saligna]